jgi:hypothetical protein
VHVLVNNTSIDLMCMYLQSRVIVRSPGHGRQDAIQCGGGGRGPDLWLQAAPVPQKLQQTDAQPFATPKACVRVASLPLKTGCAASALCNADCTAAD